MRKLTEKYWNMSLEELRKEIEKTENELYKLNVSKSGGAKVEKPHLFKKYRREIARMKTILARREAENE
jgi:large subunit ribosomal protein L29